MCGITGFIDFSRQAKREFLLGTVEKMATTFYHRGSDSAGAWADEAHPIHLRLLQENNFKIIYDEVFESPSKLSKRGLVKPFSVLTNEDLIASGAFVQ
jgi:glutamate synthase domain-containing protein 1